MQTVILLLAAILILYLATRSIKKSMKRATNICDHCYMDCDHCPVD